MHLPINVKSLHNNSKWQMGFNSAFKGLSSPCGEKCKILILQCNTTKKNNSDTHAECVLLLILIKQKTGYVHEKCSTE
jgi:hypothetical protein